MHPANKILAPLGMQLRRIRKAPSGFLSQYRRDFEKLQKNGRGFAVFKEMYYEVGAHPESFADFECRFVAKHVAKFRPKNVIDIGSYRLFILGLLSGYEVTSVDVRSRQAATHNEKVIVCDAKQLSVPDDSYDMVIALCAVEHFGLGRYGDEFDENGDIKAIKEVVRVLRPGGRLLFSTTITRGKPAIAFNAHRIYSREALNDLCTGLTCEEEQFFSNALRRPCAFDEVTLAPTTWDVYAGCWVKPGRVS